MRALLTKYSRQYPQAINTSSPSNATDWQHFVNPIIELRFDKQKDTSRRITRAKLEIVWSMSNGPDAMDVDSQKITFEDLDLLAFSSGKTREAQSAPLKAVYRDLAVGIRYQHPLHVPVGETPTFRRVQLTFDSLSGASSFVDALREICPCSYNAPTKAPNRTTTIPTTNSAAIEQSQVFTQMPTRAMSMAPRNAPSSQPMSPRSAVSSEYQFTSSPRIQDSRNIGSEPPPSSWDRLPSSQPLTADTLSGPMIPQNFSSPRRTPNPAAEPPVSSYPIPSNSHPSSVPSFRPSSHPSSSTSRATVEPSGSVGPSQQPQHLELPPGRPGPLHPPPREYNRANVEPFLRELQRETRLYDLSIAELEEVVAAVIWEDGFEKLLRNVNTVMTMRGYYRFI